MDIEQMTKAQLVLLALLVSFVTSIATSIATASLLERAPAEVTRVIDRVVERTVETVTPSANSTGESVTTKETTVVVREDDLITKSVSAISLSLIRLYTTSPEGRNFIGMGFVVTKEGKMTTASSIVVERGVYTARLSSGKEVEAIVVSQDEKAGFAVLEAIGTQGNVEFAPVGIGDAQAVKLGQGVIAVTGEEGSTVSIGIVSNIRKSSGENPLPTGFEMSTGGSILPGTPLSNLFGEVVGIKASTESNFFAPILDQKALVGT